MPTTVILNERIDGFAGRVSATESKANSGVAAAAAVDGANGFGAATSGQGKGSEQENKEQDFVSIHLAPHARLVCVCHPGKENAQNHDIECNAE